MIPNNPQTEADVIWLLMNYQNAPIAIMSHLSADDFYNLNHRQNFISAIESYKKDGVVDFHKIERLYDYGAEYYVSELWTPKLVKELKELSKKRKLLKLSDNIQLEIQKQNADVVLKNTMQELVNVNAETQKAHSDVFTIAKKTIEQWKVSKDKDLIGTSTGFPEIDKLISGFQPGHFWVVGGYTNYGKTTLAISFLSHLLRNTESPLLYCSIEMSQIQIFEKIISNFTRETPYWNAKNFYLPMVQDAVLKVSKSKLEITDDVFDVDGIILKIQEMIINGNKPEVVFVDFIQNVKGKGNSEYERITNATLQLQSAARMFNVCIVVLSQVNNQSTGTSSEVIGFKSSGALPAAGDITIQIVRDKAKEVEAAKLGTATDFVDMSLIIQKNRHGRCGGFPFDFDVTKGLIVNH